MEEQKKKIREFSDLSEEELTELIRKSAIESMHDQQEVIRQYEESLKQKNHEK